jgi:hypothetical protein
LTASIPRVLGRVAFAVGFFGLELWGIVQAQRTPDRAFGFQMFNESSRVTLHLYREVARKKRRVLLPLLDGRWRAPDAQGVEHDFAWHDRLYAPGLFALEQSMHARYGLEAQLFRVQAALDDLVRHIPNDTQTLALVVDVETLKNGQPGPRVRLRADKP